MHKSTDPVQCCRCKNKHDLGDRIDKPDAKHQGVTNSTCPRCGAREFFDLTPSVAYCWRSGLIEFGETAPPDAIPIAAGPIRSLKPAVEVVARHGKGTCDGRLIVPGIPEANSDKEAVDALDNFLRFAAKGCRYKDVKFTEAGNPCSKEVM